MSKREYNPKTKRPWHFRFFKGIFKIFKKKVEVLDLNEGNIADKCIFVANHSGASGPFSYELFFPKYFIPWGHHQMCGNYKDRWNYLYHIFYQQKLHYNKFKSFLIATVFAIISKSIYTSVGLIGTYTDARLHSTIKKSFKVFEKNMPILIFPENSNEGYKEILEEYHSGFVTLSNLYFRRTKEDLPVYNVYYSKKLCKMVIDKPVYLNELLKTKTPEEIAQMFVDRTNELYRTYLLKKDEEKVENKDAEEKSE